MSDLNDLMTSWRRSLSDLTTAQVQELEDHLRAEMERLHERDLNEREAFMVAAMRCGRPNELMEQYVAANPTTMWLHRLRWGIAGCLVAILGMRLVSAGLNLTIWALLQSGMSDPWIGGILVATMAMLTTGVFIGGWGIARYSFHLPVIHSPRLRFYLGTALLLAATAIGLTWLYLGFNLFRIGPYGPQYQYLVAAQVMVMMLALALGGLWQLWRSRGRATHGTFQFFVRFFAWTAVMCCFTLGASLPHLLLNSGLNSGGNRIVTIMVASSIVGYSQTVLLPVVLIFTAIWVGRRQRHIRKQYHG